MIYYEGKYISRDINISIYYFTNAANQNDPIAQYILGVLYYFGNIVEQNISKAIIFLKKSSENDIILAHFSLGFLYHDGKYLKRDMKKSIHHYKEASSFNNKYAKNNLGIIYRHGFGVDINLIYAKIYFKEAIKEEKDPVSMYNLAHIYFYDESTNEYIDKSIELLKQSSNKGFSYSTILLCIALVKKYEKNDKMIKKELLKYMNYKNESLLINIIYHSFKYYYSMFKEIDFLYDFGFEKVITKSLYEEKKNDCSEINITDDFYEGFGKSLL